MYLANQLVWLAGAASATKKTNYLFGWVLCYRVGGGAYSKDATST